MYIFINIYIYIYILKRKNPVIKPQKAVKDIIMPNQDILTTKNSSINKIHFKFNQGFSNAVKRTVSIKEFL